MNNKVEQEEKNVESDDKKTQLNEELDNQRQESKDEAAQNEPESGPKTEPADPLKKLQDDLAEAKDKYVRLYAEFENHRRRTSKEKLEMIQSANEQLIKQLLPVIDDFERAEKAFADKKDDSAVEGFLLIHNKLKKNLEQYGLKVMETSKGADFDPDFHEAITQIQAGEKDKGKIVDVIENGYLLFDKVIRYAKVVVGN